MRYRQAKENDEKRKWMAAKYHEEMRSVWFGGGRDFGKSRNLNTGPIRIFPPVKMCGAKSPEVMDRRLLSWSALHQDDERIGLSELVKGHL